MLCGPFHFEDAPFFCSKRAFQTQFRRWNFPSKQRPAHKNDRLVARIKELWEKNLSQREMLRALNDEDGFDIKPRELIRVRTKNRWLLRLPNANTDGGSLLSLDVTNDDDDDNGHDSNTDDGNDGGSGILLGNNLAAASTSNSDLNMQESDGGSGTPVLPAGGRRSRRRGRQSGQDLHSTVVAGSNRFPSEMTIDEAREILSLDTATYRTLRVNFQQICQEDCVSRKTEAGPERWAAVKHRLVGSSTALQRMLWAGGPMAGSTASNKSSNSSFDQRQLALDVICTDVTKRLRTMETRMTLGEAKAKLGVNPGESRDMRAALHAILAEAQVFSKSDMTTEQWETLKRQWGQRSPPVGAILGDGRGSDDFGDKIRALEAVASDVMKRIRDKRNRGGAKKSKQSLFGEGQQPQGMQSMNTTAQSSPATTHDQLDLSESLAGSFEDVSEVPQMTFNSHGDDAMQISMNLSQGSSITPDSSQHSSHGGVLGTISTAMQLDSSDIGSVLLLGPGGQAQFMSHHQQTYFSQPTVVPSSSSQVYQQPPASSHRHHHQQPLSTTASGPARGALACAIYLRLHPASTFDTNTGLWVATLESQSVQELREAAVARFPGAVCVRIEGIIKDSSGGELPLQIEQEQELAAYLAHIQDGSPTFNVQLMWRGRGT